MAEAKKKAPGAGGGLARWQKLTLWAVLALLVTSAGARAAFLAARPARSGSPALEASSYVASSEPRATADEGPIERSLPYVTEGSLFGLIGIALGYAARKVFKLVLVLIALAFLAVQTLVWFDVIAVDWGGVAAWLNANVLHSKASGTVTEFVTKRVPSVGALGLGYFVGWRRG